MSAIAASCCNLQLSGNEQYSPSESGSSMYLFWVVDQPNLHDLSHKFQNMWL